MTDTEKEKKPLRLSNRGRLEIKKPGSAAGQVRQSFSHGRTKTVTVEVKKKRASALTPSVKSKPIDRKTTIKVASEALDEAMAQSQLTGDESGSKARVVLKALTDDEKAARARALEDSRKASALARERAEEVATQRAEEEARLVAEREAAVKRGEEESRRKRTEELARQKAALDAAKRLGETDTPQAPPDEEASADRDRRKRPARGEQPRRSTTKTRAGGDRRRTAKMTVSTALDDRERTRSLASMRRQREREKRQAREGVVDETPSKVYRDVNIPDTITVEELANRMTERGADVIKSLMKMGVMATINQSIDADTAELVVDEFGHRPKRVSESDVEIGFLTGDEDDDSLKISRSPVVTVMGHVDHGKTSLLDALRETTIVSGEAGGITQHIGAYQVQIDEESAITFLDTPGHEAFTSMRARGAKVTDLVVLVVAADDGVMPQTVEAIKHARAAETPIVVAINKIDRPDADSNKVKQGLLQHEVFVEEMGGDVLCVEVSAQEKTGLDKLLETIVLQSEILDLKANVNRLAEGVVIEAKVEKGRGSVATVLVQRGTLRIGDVLVAGKEWGRVRALLNDRGDRIQEAMPGQPAELLGLSGTPDAGDEFGVIDGEGRAREIASFRQSQLRMVESAKVASARGSLDQIFSQIEDGATNELPIVIKTDVHGSLEAIQGTLAKIGTEEVIARILHGGVGGINESDVTLANASQALIIGFNVRANSQARDRAKKDGVDIRYYSVIYELVDDIKAIMSGLLEPTYKETILGQARVKEVFTVSKVGRVAGCEVTDGIVRRNAKVRLVRDDIVVHEGNIETLKHFKDDTSEVRSGSDCGIGLANYGDVQKGDKIEIYETEQLSRTL